MKKIYLIIIGLLVFITNSSEASSVFCGDSTNNTDSTSYFQVEEPPIFPGGEKALFKFIKNNIKYPEDARKKGLEGRVLISFIIEKDGSITNAKVVQGIGYGCDEEALRIENKLPKFTPGKHSGFPVRVQTGIPLNFRLSL